MEDKENLQQALAEAAAQIPREVLNQLHELVDNAITSRRDFLTKYTDPRRNIAKECGHPEQHAIDKFMLRDTYDRNPIGRKVVQFLPKETWKVQPSVFELEDSEEITAFEQAWDDVAKNLRGGSLYQDEDGNPIWNYLYRLDVLAGIGQFGVLLLGIDDKKDLREPVAGFTNVAPEFKPPKETTEEGELGKADDKVTGNLAPAKPLKATKEDDEEDEDSEDATEIEEDKGPLVHPKEKMKHKLLYLRVFDESLVEITQYDSEPTSPRYGMPTEYTLTLNDPSNTNVSGTGLATATITVHWSRVLHFADNLSSSEIFGDPRQRPVFDRLLDLSKLYAGSAEMYWRGAFPGLSIETHPQLMDGALVKIDKESVRAAAERYLNTLQRMMITEGMTVKSLAPQVVDPTPQINAQISAICIAIDAPERIFMGSERGELASSQDSDSWEDRMKERRSLTVTPFIIVPLVDRLIQYEVLPTPKGYSVDWEHEKELKPLDQADVANKTMEALSKYISGGVDAIVSPMDALTKILPFDEETAEAILDATMKYLEESNPDAEVIVPGQKPVPPVIDNPVKMREGEQLFDKQGQPLTDPIPTTKAAPK